MVILAMPMLLEQSGQNSTVPRVLSADAADQAEGQ
jgi:hypothetical protein